MSQTSDRAPLPRSAPSPDAAAFLDELRWRGLVQDMSEGLEARLARGPISAYIGFDPTGRSLHIGHMVQVMLLTHLQRAGGRPVALVGGGTGMVGDPSGKSEERNLLDEATLEANKANFRAQLERFLDFSPGPAGAVMLDNREWLGGYGLLEFLRDVGKHFTLSYMLVKDSVQLRLQRGLSFTEFSYMTLQAADFLHLYREHGVEMQMGGADQWGNITAGLELIRRVEGREEGAEPAAFALSTPLLLTGGGQKMGKTERGAIYLDPQLTSPFDFYQSWLNQPDDLVGAQLRRMTLLSRSEVEALEAEQAARPEARPVQKALAFDVTARVHGREEAERQRRVAELAFAAEPLRDPADLALLHAALAGFEFSDEELRGGPIALALAAGLYASRGEARRAIAQGGFSVNDARVASPEAALPEPIAGEWLVLRAGRRQLRIGRRRPG